MAENRLISLDVFRGLTIAGMVLVNNPGGSPVYWPLEHAEWHGLTPTDWIFPFFLFIVGVSIAISLGRRLEPSASAEGQSVSHKPSRQYAKIFTRAASIYLLGAAISVVPFFQFQSTDAPDPLKMVIWLTFCASLLFLLLRNYKVAAVLCVAALLGIVGMNLAGYNVVPYNYGTLRIFGVLQRIAVCYLITSIIFLHTSWRQQVGIGVVLLLVYWLIMTVIPVPGCDVTSISDKACNLAAYIDRLILTENHIWRGGKVYDPEGILSTIPAIVTTISGVLAGTWLVRGPHVSKGNSDNSEALTYVRATDTVSGIFFFGVTLLALGLIWHSYFPMNKALWTSSYVLATSGLALLVLGCCYWLIDIKGYERWAWPFKVFGANALALFVFAGFFARMISAYRVTGADGQLVSIQKVVMQNVFLPIFNPIDASLAFAISFILLWLFLMWLLYRKQILIKV
ncbi:MAG TPA: heparan-alpha-glucosaminide N-acetyltransferase domain-containing protein [Pyrinomonadaceae bacterium]|nr:heparan-alpha-glucosaminide N-acetyltransferase domain-containing protein [Pyrinomonadaceae bacterium]